MGDVTATLEVQPRSSTNEAVSVCVNIDFPAQFKSVEVDYCVKDFNYERATSHVFEEGSLAWGWSEFVSSSVARNTERCTFECSMSITNVTPVEPTQSLKLLCASVNEQDQLFADAVHGLYSNRFFFSAGFRRIIQRETVLRKGSAGLPGSLVPEPALAVLATLRKKLPQQQELHLRAMGDISRAVFQRVLCAAFAAYPKALNVVLGELEGMFVELEARAGDSAKELLSLEEEVLTSNHYFSSTVMALRQLLAKEGDNQQVNIGHQLTIMWLSVV